MSKRKKISIVEFTRRYSTEEACREHLAEQRWPEGFVCPCCGNVHAHQLSNGRYYIMCNMFSQSIGYGFRASIISCAWQGLFLIPVLAIRPSIFGLRGLQLAQPVSNVLAFFLAFVLTSKILKELGEKE